MIQYVFKPSRRVSGKRVMARTYSGRYALRAGDRPATVSLYTTNKKVAEKRLRDLVAAKQCEAEGIVQPEAIRSAAAATLVSLVSEYKADLQGRDLAPAHVTETIRRIERAIEGTGWARLADVTPASFVAWRAKLACAAKTKKEFQVSLNAFFNWLVRLGRLAVNPLKGADMVDIRGKAVRVSRAFTQAELRKLCEVAPAYRRIVYLFLVYTGARTNEARALLWDDVNLGERPCVVFRASTTKDKDKRTVPLHPELVQALRVHRAPIDMTGEGLEVFERFPSDDALQADMRRAGIERRDATGRVLHFHAFRKTFQTWGAQSGVGQRAAQEMLGHSDPALTANVYTDVAALGLHAEVAKLPWVMAGDRQGDVRTTARTDCASSCAQTPFRAVLTQLVELAQKAISEGDNTVFALPHLAARHGFEP